MTCSRRRFLGRSALVLGSAIATPGVLLPAAQTGQGAVIGEPSAAKAGQQILNNGGNAVDAIVGAALAACVASAHNCGIAGYGGHMVIAMRGRKVTAIDYNTMAPAAAREDMFAPNENGDGPGSLNVTGWLAAGVPGTLAGLDLALKKYGTRTFGEVASAAIELAEEGFAIGQGMAGALRRTAVLLRKDPGSSELLLKDGEPPQAGDRFRNPRLAELLRTLSATRDPTAEFYRGTVGAVIADAFSRNGGLVTRKDLAAYHAREVEPLRLSWQQSKVYTAPLTAGGLTVLEALAILKRLRWMELPENGGRTFLRIESLRQAWHDRLTLLGDPEKTKVPVRRLASDSYAEEKADEIRYRLKVGQPLPYSPEPRLHGGTVHLSAADAAGNMVAATLTHGDSFGARVTVDEFGIVMGHGMSRFNTEPGHPNSPGPHKRPLHNMCPTIVATGGEPALALGGAGGRKIPNSVFDVLVQHLLLAAPLREAVAAPRLHTEGSMNVFVEAKWPEAEVSFLKERGYNVKNGTGALISAVGRRVGGFEAISR